MYTISSLAFEYTGKTTGWGNPRWVPILVVAGEVLGSEEVIATRWSALRCDLPPAGPPTCRVPSPMDGEGIFEVKATAGGTHLGVKDFDNRLFPGHQKIIWLKRQGFTNVDHEDYICEAQGGEERGAVHYFVIW
ncbi:hypothetical protein M405DRAFT_846582 [Rhizopogon salebrosus TDB-379]|nr:hypothetical protein M405DRAFT_846582 [Rhizopogon salebrosus TDB-379]